MRFYVNLHQFSLFVNSVLWSDYQKSILILKSGHEQIIFMKQWMMNSFN